MGAFGEEVVAAVAALAEVVVLPGLFAACGGAGEYGLAVDADLDGADVAGEVVGFPIGGGEGALQDRGVVAGAGGVFVAEPLLQVVEGERLAGVEELGAMVARARWLVSASRESVCGTPDSWQRAGRMLWLR